jgi:hypothetical protein
VSVCVCVCALSERVCGHERERQTHQHHLDRVCHDSHIGPQDVIVEGWGQHSSVLEPCLPIQQEQTIPWVRDRCVYLSGGDGSRKTLGIILEETWGKTKEQPWRRWNFLGKGIKDMVHFRNVNLPFVLLHIL